MPPDLPSRTDLIIAGAGLAGLSLAVAVKQALGERFGVIVADPAFGRPQGPDGRASAIAAAARRLFEVLGVWAEVAPKAQPILDMVVTDSRTRDPVRPVFLTFGGEVEPGEPFAHMVFNRDIIAALEAKARALGVVLTPQPVTRFSVTPEAVAARFGEAGTVEARLLAACDGANSKLRTQAGIPVSGWGYDQSGIVATVAHERPHEGRAEEHFLPPGPFAILPLTENRSSIVWTERTADAARTLELPDALLMDELKTRFGLKLGEIHLIDKPKAYPLKLQIARRFVDDRLALVGDAAHVVHPIAGQGLNLGQRDVAALAEGIVDAARLGLDIGSAEVLETYERRRRFDTVAMGVTTDVLNRLFSNRSDVLRLARDVGLGVVDRMPNLKRFFIRQAAGVVGDVPRLLRGEAL